MKQKPAPKSQRLTGGQFGAWKRAEWLLRVFYFDRDPRRLLEACRILRDAGIELPEDWHEAELWAQAQRRRRGAPRKNAERDLRILDDVLRELWPAGKDELQAFPARLPDDVCVKLAARYGITEGNLRRIVSRGRDVAPLAGPLRIPSISVQKKKTR